MAFPDETQKYINEYVVRHILDLDKIKKSFEYVGDESLRNRIAKEYYTARYLHKFFEGMQAKNELLDAQVRLQIIMFANIYEAVIHYVLFSVCANSQIVDDLQFVVAPKEIAIPTSKREMLSKELKHDGKDIRTYHHEKKRRDLTKVRFDEKAEAANKLGFIDEDLMNDLILFYNLRNGIHLHAELRKGISWNLTTSKKAFQRMRKFNSMVKAKLEKINKSSAKAP